jgi:hypothetical protein
MPKRDLPTSRSVAKHAVMHAEAVLVGIARAVRCMMQFVLRVANPVRFLLSPAVTVPFIAMTVSEDKFKSFRKSVPFGTLFLFIHVFACII